MHVFMGIGVVQIEAGCGEGGELGADFGLQFSAGGGGEEILKAQRGLVAAEFAIRRFQIWQTMGAGDCIFCFRRRDHKTGLCQPAFGVCYFDRFVNGLREPEIVRGKNNLTLN